MLDPIADNQRIDDEMHRASQYAGRICDLLATGYVGGDMFGRLVNLLREYRGDDVEETSDG